jgi:hypothetical protein
LEKFLGSVGDDSGHILLARFAIPKIPPPFLRLSKPDNHLSVFAVVCPCRTPADSPHVFIAKKSVPDALIFASGTDG